MKTTRFFAAAIALLSVLSCQKEEQQTINNSENESGAIITCTFAANEAATKTTTTDGKTPLWAAGDKIMLYDGSSNTQELTLASSGTASSTQGVIDGVDKTKFTFVKPSGWTNVYAIYPSSACVSGFSASAPKINFAGQDGTFAKANICAAVEISETMSFKNIGAILKFPSKPATVTDILIPVAGLAKNYTISFSGDTPSLATVNATNSKSYSIGSGTEAIYIGVPAENLAAGMNFIYQDSGKNILGSYATGAANDIETNKVYTLSAIAANGTIPAGMLSKAFSVSATEKVYFSKGNLQATVDASGIPTAWNFATDQYGYIGKAKANTTIGSEAGVVDFFGWPTSSTNYGISTSETDSDYSGDFKDWGENAISNGGNVANQWSTLSGGDYGGDWEYLFTKRSASTVNGVANARYCKVKVKNIPGIIIFPDIYTHPSDVTSPDAGSINSATASYTAISYDESAWTKMESAGCVFLPAAGYQSKRTTVYGTSENHYWSSVPSGTNAYYLYVDGWGGYFTYAKGRHYAMSVRLVYAAQ